MVILYINFKWQLYIKYYTNFIFNLFIGLPAMFQNAINSIGVKIIFSFHISKSTDSVSRIYTNTIPYIANMLGTVIYKNNDKIFLLTNLISKTF